MNTTARISGNTRAISRLLFGALLSGACFTGAAFAQTAPNFGPNVTIITPTSSSAAITAALNAANGEGQFGTGRHAILFMPGTYTASAQVGYYEDIRGLGLSPDQVVINGAFNSTQLDAGGDLLTNFWRGTENMEEIPPIVAGQNNGDGVGQVLWGVSQGAAFRRMDIRGDLRLTTESCAEASGGFIADSAVTGLVTACSQQQWYTRNSAFGSWQDFVWNFVFSGVTGVPATNYPGSGSAAAVTNLPTTPVSREKPFLYVDASGAYNVFVPTLKTNSVGTTWQAGGNAPGFSLPISNFFIAQPSNTAEQINAALASGKNLIMTPGIYQTDTAINITNPNTIVLGLGYATVVPQTGSAAISIADVDGVQVAGLLVDAGPVNSPVLFEVGNAGTANGSHASNPTSINDVFFRVGGATAGSATTSLQIDSGNVITDNTWLWRADHGAGSAWTGTTDSHGLVVNGNNVTALGLAVEHYEKEQTLWNGNGGETIFYQSELPYGVPSQSAWQDGSANGYPSYVVSNSVCTHKAYGMGVYSFFNVGVNIIEDNAIVVPNVTGISVTDAGTISLSSSASGQITHVIDGIGATVTPANADTLSPVASFVGNGTCNVSTPVTSSVAINAGGGTVGSFIADTDFVGGSTYTNTSKPVVTQGVAGAAPAAVYADEHEGGSFTYTVPGLTPGSTHTVRLHFAELYFSQPNQRVFNVAINSAAALSNFDIVAAAGSNFKAVVKTFTATANAKGQIVVAFTSGTQDQPLVSGIEIQ